MQDEAVLINDDRGAAITVAGLVKDYGTLRAVDGVSFTVGAGEFFGILGPNGAGKTTTLEMVEGIREPDQGSVFLLGEPVWPRNPRLLARVGVQLQGSAFFERLTCREQLQTFGDLYGVPRGRADEMLELVGLAGKADVREDQLSGGQRQRLSIACALVHAPDVVFLDEPTAALDPQARRNLWDLLREIQARGTTVVYTTHYMDEAEILCDRVAIMDAGRILALDTPAALVRGLEAATRVALPRGVLDAATARTLPGAETAHEIEDEVVLSTREPARLVAALAQRQALDGVSVRTATLEDVFLTLTGREYRA
ncbi:ABC transporter ATP-binding protein [Geodermatophilus sp. URMC 61]|uniref:ABC transporter ATP-binding protein n=1 Tax=Geodermatophilus sp. URMC 61 TaxID=3423411 RepID=UPI00406C4208